MNKLISLFQGVYVKVMIWMIGRLLEATSKVDKQLAEEIAAIPATFAFSMGVMPGGPDFAVQKQLDGTFYCKRRADRMPVDLSISFKHIKHAFLILSFQESTARSFANDRMVLSGEINLAMVIVRCLDRMEVLVLPKFIARRAVKRYPSIAISEKLFLALKIYFHVLVGLFRRHHV